MPKCSLRPIFVKHGISEPDGDIIYYIYIWHEKIKPDLNEMHDWVEKNFPDNETLSIGKHYIMKDADSFEMAFKLAWE